MPSPTASQPNPAGVAGRVVLTGGGTGGHVYPCLAIYEILRRHGLVDEALYLGLAGRAEEEIVPRHGIPLRFIPSRPFAGTTTWAKLGALASLGRGVLVSMGRLLRFRPRVVVAAGGYVSAPVIVAAFLLKPLLRLRIVIDEQNLVPGLLNKFASLFADVVLVSFKETAYFMWNNRCVATGYPVRRAYFETPEDRSVLRRRLGVPEDALLLVVAGGSMGARSVNRALAQALPRLSRIDNLFIVHSVGLSATEDYDALADTGRWMAKELGEDFDAKEFEARRSDGKLFYRGFRYLDNLFDYQAAADLLISRSGAGSLAEILALGKPAILVPKRDLPGDHQELNAIAVAEKGGAEVIFERRDPRSGTCRADPRELLTLVEELVASPRRLEELAAKAHAQFEAGMEEAIVGAVRGVLARSPIDFVSQVVEPRFVRFQRQFDSLVQYLDVVGRDKDVDRLYRRYYEIKLDEYLASEDFLLVNRGIKLIGALGRRDRYPFIRDNFSSFRGYLKRNALAALCKAESWEPCFADLITLGLEDAYFETRREAVALYRRFHAELQGHSELQERILALIERPFESWEVRGEAMVAAVLFLEDDEFLRRMFRFRASRRIRLREALLEAISIGLREGRFSDPTKVRLFVKRMLITTSEFKPHFRVRARFIRVVEQLERMR